LVYLPCRLHFPDASCDEKDHHKGRVHCLVRILNVIS
jgi:hypothetical protein